MRSKRSKEWAAQAEALAVEMAHASDALTRYAVEMNLGGDELAYHDAKIRVDACRAGYLAFHGTYNPGNVRSGKLFSFLTLDAGLRRMLGGITAQLSANAVASGSTDDEQLEFLGTVHLEGRKVAKENLEFMDQFVGVAEGKVVEVTKVSQRLEAHHDQLLAMLEKVEDVSTARQSGEATSRD